MQTGLISLPCFHSGIVLHCLNHRSFCIVTVCQPPHAQVPNVMEFADWVGRTKQKPIYVTGGRRQAGTNTAGCFHRRCRHLLCGSTACPARTTCPAAVQPVPLQHNMYCPPVLAGTTKRPVPLQHNLYYGGQLYTICQADHYRTEVGGCGWGWMGGMVGSMCRAEVWRV